jgi:hypothetical protein
MTAGGQGGEGTGHPLPDSDEARHDEIPETLEREKGRGDDGDDGSSARDSAVNPDGSAYPIEDTDETPAKS